MEKRKITKDTQLCISIAGHPGNFGAIVFNAVFEELSMDFVYKPLRVDSHNLANAIEGIRALGIRGSGVSMPHKINVLKYLDIIDPIAMDIGAVNTIVNKNNILSGYNTDFYGTKKALEENYDVLGKKVLVIGAGGASRAIIAALKILKAGEIYISNINELKAKELARSLDISFFSYKHRNDFDGQLLINATPVGMAPNTKDIIVEVNTISKYEAVMDVVVSPFRTMLIEEAGRLGKIIMPGFQMALYQACGQFELYTNVPAPFQIMKKCVYSLLDQKII